MIPILIAAAFAFDSKMTDDQLKETGLTKLTIQERLNLREWIEEQYAKKVVAQNKSNPRVQEVLNRGKFVRLSDNSLWEIDPEDTPITQSWVTPSDIKVGETRDKDYPFSLTNNLTGSTVKARKAQKVPKE